MPKKASEEKGPEIFNPFFKKSLMTGFIRGIAEAAGETSSPFVDPAIFTEAFMDIYSRGGKTAEGLELMLEIAGGTALNSLNDCK